MVSTGRKDTASTDAEWSLPAPEIDGVQFREVKHMLTGNAAIKEAFRDDWGLHDLPIRHVITVSAWPGAVLAWHRHELQTDHVFVVSGTFQAAMYDARESSPTHGKLELRRLSDLRPGLLVIPPGVWHGFKNLTGQPAHFLNFFDRAYRYDDPDEYKLPADTDEIPYRFS